MRRSIFALSLPATSISASNIRRQNAATAALTSLSSQITAAPTILSNTDCFTTSLKPTSTCSLTQGSQSCAPTTTPIISCKSNMICFQDSSASTSSSSLTTCKPRDNTVAPAGIAFAVIVPIFLLIIAAVLIIQRIREKKRRQQALDDNVRGVHMDMRGSRKVEVRFMERRGGEGGEEERAGLVEYGGHQWDVPAPPAYSEDDRRRGAKRVPTLELNGGALPRGEDERR